MTVDQQIRDENRELRRLFSEAIGRVVRLEAELAALRRLRTTAFQQWETERNSA